MSNREEAIKSFINKGIKAQKAVDELLESEPEPGEFTKRARNIASHEISKPRNTFEITILEACDIIDKLEAENKELNKIIPMPEELIGKFFNACTEPCDIINGPCACGAWHDIEDWVRRLINGVKKVQQLQAELQTKDELLTQAAIYLRRQSNVGKAQMQFVKKIEKALKGGDK